MVDQGLIILRKSCNCLSCGQCAWIPVLEAPWKGDQPSVANQLSLRGLPSQMKDQSQEKTQDSFLHTDGQERFPSSSRSSVSRLLLDCEDCCCWCDAKRNSPC